MLKEQENMKKILIINTVGFQYEGITSVILNYLRAMNREELQCTFLTYADTPQKLKEELNRLGRTLEVPNRKEDVRNYISCLYRILAEGYDGIHVHGNSGTMFIETALAKLRGVKKILVHTHSTSTNHPAVNAVLKYPMMWLADECLACSLVSGDWLYGKHPYRVLNNAIDLGKYRFNPEQREAYRKEFQVQPEEFLVGHIGHFTPQKNHFFLLEIFQVCYAQNSNAKLLLVGEGPDRAAVKEKVQEAGLEERVIFAGRREDAWALYSAMDLFLLPSRWEGLPLVALEAQANGVPVLMSTAVTMDAKCTEAVFCAPLTDTPEDWAQHIADIREMELPRTSANAGAIGECGFDISQEAEKLREIYLR